MYSIIVSPVVKMRPHPAAHPQLSFTRKYPGGIPVYVTMLKGKASLASSFALLYMQTVQTLDCTFSRHRRLSARESIARTCWWGEGGGGVHCSTSEIVFLYFKGTFDQFEQRLLSVI